MCIPNFKHQCIDICLQTLMAILKHKLLLDFKSEKVWNHANGGDYTKAVLFSVKIWITLLEIG